MTAQPAQQTMPTATTTAATLTLNTLTFDYKAELKCITLEIKTMLKAKLEAAIANLQSLVDNLKKKFKQKLNQQIESIRVT